MKVKVNNKWKNVSSVRVMENDDYNDYFMDDIEAIDIEGMDWESFRREAAMKAMQGYIMYRGDDNRIYDLGSIIAKKSVEYADALIEELKKK